MASPTPCRLRSRELLGMVGARGLAAGLSNLMYTIVPAAGPRVRVAPEPTRISYVSWKARAPLLSALTPARLACYLGLKSGGAVDYATSTSRPAAGTIA